MYLNKAVYYSGKIVTSIFTYFWASLTILMFLPIDADIKNRWSLSFAIAIIWAGHFIYEKWLQRAKYYNSFFENDTDGYVPFCVLAKVSGRKEEQIQREIRLLLAIHVLNRLLVRPQDNKAVILNHPKVHAKTSLSPEQQTAPVLKICPHCGGENKVRLGFVGQCSFCGGSLGGDEDVS